MTEQEKIDNRIEEVRRKSQSLGGGGYHYPNSGVPSEACYDIRFLLEQLDKATLALSTANQAIESYGGPCERCAERDQHEAEAYDGYINAMEMSGFR